MQNQEIIQKAMNYAFEKHKTQERKPKGSGISYFVHLIDVASILMKEKASDNLIAAGFLHDVVEDTDYTGVSEEMLRKEFPAEIVDLVMAVTELNPENMTREQKIATWMPRKAKTIEHLKTASKEVQMLKCADKLSTIREMMSGYKEKGDEIFNFLNSPNGRIDQEWYYKAVLNNLKDIKDMKMYKELGEEVEGGFGEKRDEECVGNEELLEKEMKDAELKERLKEERENLNEIRGDFDDMISERSISYD